MRRLEFVSGLYELSAVGLFGGYGSFWLTGLFSCFVVDLTGLEPSLEDLEFSGYETIGCLSD